MGTSRGAGRYAASKEHFSHNNSPQVSIPDSLLSIRGDLAALPPVRRVTAFLFTKPIGFMPTEPKQP